MRVSDELAGRLLRRFLPNRVAQRGVNLAQGRVLIRAILTATGIELSLDQVYRGVGWLMDNPDGSPPLVMVPGDGYGYSHETADYNAAVGRRQRYTTTYLRRMQSGLVIPQATQVVMPNDPVEADAMLTRMNDALVAVANIR
jgi:hypothetical protein